MIVSCGVNGNNNIPSCFDNKTVDEKCASEFYEFMLVASGCRHA